MKKILLLSMFAVCSITYSQQVDVKREKQKSYSASNGITYKVGDAILLGRGSDTNGKFNYLQAGGLLNALSMGVGADSYAMSGDRNFAGQNAIIKKIKKETSKRGGEKVFFVVGVGSLTNGNLFIEDAIKSCEIADCDKSVNSDNKINSNDKYDRLKKIQELKDSEILTIDEFESEKAKILKD